MVKEIQSDDQHRFQCEECGYHYAERVWAEKCEAWCSAKASCNLEIIQHGLPGDDGLPPEEEGV